MSINPGIQTRAGRLGLIHQLELARHGVDLLRSKEDALQREQVRLEAHVVRTRARWGEACADAFSWLLRARALGASDEIAALVTLGEASANISPHWQASMGVTYPGIVDVVSGPEPTVVSTAALRPTIDAYQKALSTGAAHASSTTAWRGLSGELNDTRRRRRAIEQRLVPQLEASLHGLDLHLDEQDRDEALRTQLAIKQHEARRP